MKVGDTFTIAEYGCVDGGTSMPLMYACVKELRSLYGNELEVHINYEDKADMTSSRSFIFYKVSKLDHQPLFGKGTRAPPSNQTRESGGNRRI